MAILAEATENQCIDPFPADPEISRPTAAMPQSSNAKQELTRHQAVLTAKQTWVNCNFFR